MPKRHNDLFLQIANFGALLDAAQCAARGRRRKPGVAAFLSRLEPELLRLERELLNHQYQPGRYTAFKIHDPKTRTVSAAPFRDRVVHHAVCTVIEPLFERGFIYDSYANRKGKGTHRAIQRYERFRNHHSKVLRADIFRFFPAIDHTILKSDLRRRIICQDTLWLLDAIIDGANPQEKVEHYFPGDDLFTPFERRRGLPIGNLTSQFFANVYLDRLDHFVKEVLRAPGYVRYVDDFALFHDNPSVLAVWHQQIIEFLVGRRLMLHPVKTFIAATADPAIFLGFELHANGKRRLPEENLRRFHNRLRSLRDRWRAGKVSMQNVEQQVQAWIAHAKFADSYRLRHAIFHGGVFDPARKPGLSPDSGGFCAAAPGTTTQGTSALPIATGTTPTIGTTTTVSGWPVRSHARADAFKNASGEPGCVQDGS